MTPPSGAKLAELVEAEIQAWSDATPGGESDRSVAIVGASLLEAALQHALTARLVQHRAVTALFQGTGPLATLSAKIDMALATGLVQEWEWEEMNRIRRIRNRFAHGLQARSFRDPVVAQMCDALKLVRKPFFPGRFVSAKTRYMTVCGVLAALLGAREERRLELAKTYSGVLSSGLSVPLRKLLSGRLTRRPSAAPRRQKP